MPWGGRKVTDVRGVEGMWREVRSGWDWEGAVGVMWKREMSEEGPEVRRRGSVGWKARQVRDEGWRLPMSLRRCMSRTSARSLDFLLVDEEEVVVVREEVDCRIWARGRAENCSSSLSSSEEEEDEGDAESWSSLSAREA